MARGSQARATFRAPPALIALLCRPIDPWFGGYARKLALEARQLELQAMVLAWLGGEHGWAGSMTGRCIVTMISVFPVFPSKPAVSGIVKWEQVLGKRNPGATVSAIGAAGFPSLVPLRERNAGRIAAWSR